MKELIVALDFKNALEAQSLIDSLQGLPITYKVGFELFIATGPDFIKHIRSQGSEVFLDLKLHDIPNTVKKAVRSAIALDVKYLTVHLAGEREMLKLAVKECEGSRLQLLGVTVLTSMDQPQWSDLQNRIAASSPTAHTIAHTIESSVLRLAELASECAISGLICSPLELESLTKHYPNMKLITPGIRLESSKADDQTRTMFPHEAVKKGASGIVVGRPITQAPHPRSTAQMILEALC